LGRGPLRGEKEGTLTGEDQTFKEIGQMELDINPMTGDENFTKLTRGRTEKRDAGKGIRCQIFVVLHQCLPGGPQKTHPKKRE